MKERMKLKLTPLLIAAMVACTLGATSPAFALVKKTRLGSSLSGGIKGRTANQAYQTIYQREKGTCARIARHYGYRHSQILLEGNRREASGWKLSVGCYGWN